MKISARGLNRSTLARQLLLRRERVGAVEAVRKVVALQAQQPASPYLALWNRTVDFDPTELDRAFTDGTVLKSTLMRITLHAVHTDDFRAFREAVHPLLRGGRIGDRRFAASGLTAADADLLAPELLAFADRPRTGAEYEAWLQERVGVAPKSGAWWALRHYTPLVHAPTTTPWSFGERPRYVAPLDPPPVPAPPEASDAALRTLILRYLEGFGPATVGDMAQFALVQRARVKKALGTLGDDLETGKGPEGEELFDLPGAPRPDEGTPAPPRLMAMWDSTLLAYADRSRVIPPEYRASVIRRNGDVLPTLLVDGYVAGVWRPTEGGIEATAFHALPEDVWEALADEARALTAFLAGREPQVYRRYAHWWTKLPPGETRLLPGA
ncbi:winged helix DNA-binding domain-containing protein [Streptomyces sp. P9(2023)]|uniref:winged helix DNA-binding domain-containing protein n=1 Tax=Streptomyces sp. P9(2023) TaxID=3064394 RepID=UPI0028F3FFB7|nr:winged helix DNA-binding domain-containing protein [Streptomyces sp. P9(2023)]MDT9692872.1 winged helix DNA-binding domain-containing protein [Streptomyces sp. P9(2023)]